MHFNTYGGNGSALAAALVNATDVAPAVVEALLSEHRMLRAAVTAGQAGELRAWAGRLAPVFGETSQEAQIKLVNDLLGVTAARPYVSAHGGRCQVVYVDTSRNGRRRFCSPGCANRVNVAAHRARRHAG
ncbi:CGNR zinc finger domain-containing protein [Nonomuraea sp. B12E4]|uniref:CGNR zinc finger domain-containing protein n=1 Tax=Nonomuraea sp. B12E4 TaxID=3153564 RepID=UPI00325CC273